MRVLLIEDDAMIAEGLKFALASEGFSVDWVKDGELAHTALLASEHKIALLDLGLPKMSGLEILNRIRRSGSKVPIVVITARDGLNDRIEGLDAGADDYLIKPFEIPELLARMRAIIRRQAGQAALDLVAGHVSLNLATHSVTYKSVSHTLPAREFSLMQAMAEKPGMIFSRERLEEKIYGWGEEVESNAVEVLIHYIRKKFDKSIIRNVRGAGWMIAKDR